MRKWKAETPYGIIYYEGDTPPKHLTYAEWIEINDEQQSASQQNDNLDRLEQYIQEKPRRGRRGT